LYFVKETWLHQKYIILHRSVTADYGCGNW